MEPQRPPSAIPGMPGSVPHPDSALHRSREVCVFCASRREVEGGVCGPCRIKIEGRVRTRNVWVHPIPGGGT